jgi:hypothetical protein
MPGGAASGAGPAAVPIVAVPAIAAPAVAAIGDAQFLAALEAATLPAGQFNHAAHVRAGYLYLRRQPFPQATAAMCTTVANYARALGKPDRYHETITVAFMALINAQLRRHGDDGGWEEFRARHPQLLQPDALLAYYPREVLESPAARACFTLLPLPGQPLPR